MGSSDSSGGFGGGFGRPGVLGNLNNNNEFGFSASSNFSGGFQLQGKSYAGGSGDAGGKESLGSVERRNPFAANGATHILGGGRKRGQPFNSKR